MPRRSASSVRRSQWRWRWGTPVAPEQRLMPRHWFPSLVSDGYSRPPALRSRHRRYGEPFPGAQEQLQKVPLGRVSPSEQPIAVQVDVTSPQQLAWSG